MQMYTKVKTQLHEPAKGDMYIPYVLTTYLNEWELLTHWGRDEKDAIFQTTLLNAFSWMKMYELPLRFHWYLFLRFV